MPDQASNQDYPRAEQLQIGTNAVEDRVVLIAGTKAHGRRGVLLTRRLVKSLLSKYAQVLEQTSEAASQAASGYKAEILQMEHVAAQAQMNQAGGDGGEGEQTERPVEVIHLATRVHLEPRDDNILLAFDGVRRDRDEPNGSTPKPAAAILMDRMTAHKVLAMLQEKGNEAGWDLAKPTGWTDELQQAKAGAVN